MGDWLGTGNIASTKKKFIEFRNAREFARNLGFKSIPEWTKYCKGEYRNKPPKPSDIPSNPNKNYKDQGWKNWGDWLGTDIIASYLMKYRKFDDAREFVRKLGLKNLKEWRKYSKGEFSDKPPKPLDIPTAADVIYKNNGWKGWGDWLRTE